MRYRAENNFSNSRVTIEIIFQFYSGFSLCFDSEIASMLQHMASTAAEFAYNNV